MSYKTTKRQFQLFKNSVLKWQDKLNLNNWRVVIVHEDPENLKEAGAWISWDQSGRVATIGLTLNWESEVDIPNELEIKRMAFHECCELMLSPLESMAASREWDQWRYDCSKHDVIRVLEKELFK